MMQYSIIQNLTVSVLVYIEASYNFNPTHFPSNSHDLDHWEWFHLDIFHQVVSLCTPGQLPNVVWDVWGYLEKKPNQPSCEG